MHPLTVNFSLEQAVILHVGPGSLCCLCNQTEAREDADLHNMTLFILRCVVALDTPMQVVETDRQHMASCGKKSDNTDEHRGAAQVPEVLATLHCLNRLQGA